ncbi:hypothetical protein RQP46_008372 [Phenoliferia psychrophenolica]
MNKFNQFAASAKVKAEEGRTKINSQLHKNDAGSASSASSARPTSHHSSGGSDSVFVNLDATEREAFFSILDEYFASRPQYADFFKGSAGGGGGGAPQAPQPAPPAAAPRAAAPPKPPVRKGLGIATASYDYAGAEAEDLSFSEGELITVLEKVSDDWWKGELRGKSGLFPSAYVVMQ